MCLWQAQGSQTYIIECLKKAGRQQAKAAAKAAAATTTTGPSNILAMCLAVLWPPFSGLATASASACASACASASAAVVVVHCFGPKQGMLQLCSLHTFQQFMFGM